MSDTDSMSNSAPIDPWLLAKLVCPVTRTSLRWDAATNELVSDAAALAFPLRDGVPILILREARAL
jgi:uncharacterized protein YbaR (Trm112 family)